MHFVAIERLRYLQRNGMCCISPEFLLRGDHVNLLLQTLALQIVQLVVFREQRGILLRVGQSRLKLEQTRCCRRFDRRAKENSHLVEPFRPRRSRVGHVRARPPIRYKQDERERQSSGII